MSIPRSVAEVIGDHVTKEVESIDRGWMGVMINEWLLRAEAFVEGHRIPVNLLKKRQWEDEVASGFRAGFQETAGISVIGKTQE